MNKNLPGTKLKYIAICVFILLTFEGRSQEMLGLGFSNYSGISGKNINPAFLTGSKVYLDVNIAGAGLFLGNDFAYIPKGNASIWSIIRGDSIPLNYGTSSYEKFYTYYKNKSYYNFASVATIMGPALMIQDGKHAFGVSLSVRSYQSAYHVPGRFLRNLYNGMPDTSLINLDTHFKNFGFTSLSWAELSFNYAYDFYERYGNKLTAGIELKVLYGVEGFYTSVDELNYHWPNDSEVRIDSVNTTVGFALPINYNNSAKTNLNPSAKGHGVGVSIGFLYTKDKSNISVKGGKALCAKPYEDYKYRIGLSILDIGSIRFNRNTQLHQFQTGSITRRANQFGVLNTVNATMRSLSQLIYGDSTKSLKGSVIYMSLPTAMSLQLDYHFKKNWYVSGFWVHPLRFQNKSLRRPAQFAIIPRYETRMFGISLPISLYDYQQLRMGLAVRLYTITVGTEKLGTLLGMDNLTGMDFYFNIKFNLLKGTCVSWKQGACPRIGNRKRRDADR